MHAPARCPRARRCPHSCVPLLLRRCSRDCTRAALPSPLAPAPDRRSCRDACLESCCGVRDSCICFASACCSTTCCRLRSVAWEAVPRCSGEACCELPSSSSSPAAAGLANAAQQRGGRGAQAHVGASGRTPRAHSWYSKGARTTCGYAAASAEPHWLTLTRVLLVILRVAGPQRRGRAHVLLSQELLVLWRKARRV